MELNQFYTVATSKEFSFGVARFTPVNVDFFIRLLEWHGKEYSAVARVLAQEPSSKEEELRLLETTVALIHTATYPYMQDKFTVDVWKNTCFKWVLADANLVRWFLEYFASFLPEGKEKSSGKS